MKARHSIPLLLLVAVTLTGCGISKAVGIRNNFSADLVTDQQTDATMQFQEDAARLEYNLKVDLNKASDSRRQREAQIELEYAEAMSADDLTPEQAADATNAYRDALDVSRAQWEQAAMSVIDGAAADALQIHRRYIHRMARADGVAALNKSANKEADAVKDFISGIREMDEYDELVTIIKAVAGQFGLDIPDGTLPEPEPQPAPETEE